MSITVVVLLSTTAVLALDMSLKDRMKEVRGADSQVVAAKKAGMSQPNWSKLERGETGAEDTAMLPQIAEAYGVSLDWLAYGRGHKMRRGENLIRSFHPEDPAADQEVRIPESRLRFSGGPGAAPVFETVDDTEPATYRMSYFHKERLNPLRCRRFRVTGNSMEPMLFPGDSILVNADETNIQNGFIYVFRHGDEMKVKQLFKRPGGAITLHSINFAEYPDEVIQADHVDEITILGRVRDRSGRGGLAGGFGAPISAPTNIGQAELDKNILAEIIALVDAANPRSPDAKAALIAELYDLRIAEPKIPTERLLRLVKAAS